MAGICTAHSRKGGAGCDHHSVTVVQDGSNVTLDVEERELDAADWDAPIPAEWLQLTAKQLYVKLGFKRQRMLGLALDNAVGRVVTGEEATKVKEYNIIGPGASLAITNVGTTYRNVSPAPNGERTLIDFTGCTLVRIGIAMTNTGTQSGTLQLEIVRDSDNQQLWESTAQGGTGEKSQDTVWLPLPQWVLDAAGTDGEIPVRARIKSSVAADDPVVRRVKVLVK